MGMRLKRSGGPSNVFSLTVAELGFEPIAGYGNAAFIFFFFSEFIFSPVLSVTYLPITLFFKDTECHRRILFCGSYLQNTLFFGYDNLQMELIHILLSCPNTVITKGDDFFQVQEPSHDLMLHLLVMTL